MLFDIYREHSIASETCRVSVPARLKESCGDARPASSIERLPDYDRVAKLAAELDVTGIPFTMHPAVLLPSRYVTGGSVEAGGLGDGCTATRKGHRQAAFDAATRSVAATRLHGFVGRKVAVAGFVATARRARTNDNRVMGFVTLEDATGLIEVSFFPDQIALYRTICSYGGPVWVSGKVTEHLSSLCLDASACGRME
jgi:DNA polymerase III alpha subunit